MGEGSKEPRDQICVLQVVDKCAMRGATIHGMARLLLTWWPAFQGTEFSFSLCVLRGREGGLNEFRVIGVDVIDLNRHRIDPRTILDLAKIIRRDDIQIIHCHGYGSSTFGRVAAKICRIPVIVHEHMIDEKIPIYQKVVDFLISPLTTKGIAVSNAVANFMTGQRFIRGTKIEVVYNAIAPGSSQTITANQKKVIANEIGIPINRPIIGMVGRLDPVKGHTFFLDAAFRVLKREPHAHFIILGDGELHDQLLTKSQQLGIDHHISFLGHRSDVEEIVSLFDVYVSCSITEGLGIANIEAMALSKAIVATNVGGIPELIEDGVTGILVPPRDPSSIAKAIVQILADADLRDKLGENAFAQCQERFLIPGITMQLRRIYCELIESA